MPSREVTLEKCLRTERIECRRVDANWNQPTSKPSHGRSRLPSDNDGFAFLASESKRCQNPEGCGHILRQNSTIIVRGNGVRALPESGDIVFVYHEVI